MSLVLRRNLHTCFSRISAFRLHCTAPTSYAVPLSTTSFSGTFISSHHTTQHSRQVTQPFSTAPSSIKQRPAVPASAPIHLLSAIPMSLFSSVPLWLCCVAVYVSVSAVLLYFPSLLFPVYPRRREVCYSVRYGAHRGGGGERIENTLSAFEHAVACGCTLLELDVHLTKDGQVVVVHDATLHRTTGQPLHVRDTNFADLPRCLPSLPAPPPFSPPGTLTSYSVADTAPASSHDDAYRIPLLSTVLERFPHSVVNIDLKDNSDELCDACIEVIEAADAHDRVIWGSMHSRLSARMSAARPDWHMFCSPREVLLIYLKFITGLLPFLPIGRGQYVELPYIGRQMRPLFVSQLSPRIGQRAAEWLVAGVAWLAARRVLFEHLQQRGHPVVLWVLNEPSEMREVLEQAGAAGIMTDYPQRMQRTFNISATAKTQR